MLLMSSFDVKHLLANSITTYSVLEAMPDWLRKFLETEVSAVNSSAALGFVGSCSIQNSELNGDRRSTASPVPFSSTYLC